MRQYELTYLISDDVAESEINKVSGRINGYIADAKGKVLKEESWGRRKLAYPILKQQFATYITLNFELEPEKLREIEKDIIHAPEILRHLTIVRTFGKEEMTLTAEDIAETGDIEEVVGGEKSFEAIEGETEDSRDLMAVRGESEEEGSGVKAEETPVAEEKMEEEVAEPAELETVEDTKEKKTVKPRAKKAEKETPKVEVKEVEATMEEKPAKTEAPVETVEEKKKPASKSDSAKATPDKAKVKTKAIKDDNVEDEADRLAKLDKELDDILGDDL
jgi:small subunit ribosomal protein S6